MELSSQRANPSSSRPLRSTCLTLFAWWRPSFAAWASRCCREWGSLSRLSSFNPTPSFSITSAMLLGYRAGSRFAQSEPLTTRGATMQALLHSMVTHPMLAKHTSAWCQPRMFCFGSTFLRNSSGSCCSTIFASPLPPPSILLCTLRTYSASISTVSGASEVRTTRAPMSAGANTRTSRVRIGGSTERTSTRPRAGPSPALPAASIQLASSSSVWPGASLKLSRSTMG
mmetsp:Transcript_57419/g.131820  ORF Transcript_57419/g.131820 Transcript_57419/m.131820 type:complete len:228 (+) Transcript_57419:45-728(+)